MRQALLQSMAFVCLVGLATGCGPSEEPSSALNAGLNSSSIKVFVGPAEVNIPGAHQLLVSAPEAVRQLSICSVQNGACAPNAVAQGSIAATGNGKNIFQFNSPVMVQQNAVYLVRTGEAEGLPEQRSFTFEGLGGIGSGIATQGSGSGGEWKAVLMTGDNSIMAFDNGRKTLAQIFSQRGIRTINQLSMSPDGTAQQASAENLRRALGGLSLGPNDTCLLHMTSHGSRQGFFMKGQGQISPSEFNQILDSTCGNRPTVALVSACYSGVMINQETSKPNRIILTAARNDRTSFGCGPKNQYTYWDDCLIQKFQSLGAGFTGEQLYREVYSCIEQQEGGTTSSDPQSFFGARMKNFRFFPGAGQPAMQPMAGL